MRYLIFSLPGSAHKWLKRSIFSLSWLLCVALAKSQYVSMNAKNGKDLHNNYYLWVYNSITKLSRLAIWYTRKSDNAKTRCINVNYSLSFTLSIEWTSAHNAQYNESDLLCVFFHPTNKHTAVIGKITKPYVP